MRTVSRSLLALCLLVCFLALALPAAASAVAPFWWSVDAGGAYAAAGQYQLGATAGQPDAGTVSGGWYTLRGGYWPGATVRHIRVEVPGGLEISRQFTYGQLTIVATALGLVAVWRWGKRRIAA